MSVTIRRNFGPLANIKLFTRDDMREIGLAAIERIRRRTLGGHDVDNAAFHPYSPGYVKRKAALGGRPTVDLEVSGAMLRGITIVEVTDTKVVIGFSS